MTKQQIINTVAKSDNQRWMVQRLLAGDIVQFNVHYCTHTRHYDRYVQSWTALIQRLYDAGIKINYKKGKFGGVWSSKISLA